MIARDAPVQRDCGTVFRVIEQNQVDATSDVTKLAGRHVFDAVAATPRRRSLEER
jgi:hypothetical protein